VLILRITGFLVKDPSQRSRRVLPGRRTHGEPLDSSLAVRASRRVRIR
jgi:hypothetical protein